MNGNDRLTLHRVANGFIVVPTSVAPAGERDEFVTIYASVQDLVDAVRAWAVNAKE